MSLEEVLLLVCIVGGFIGLIYSIKHTCKKYMGRKRHNDDK